MIISITFREWRGRCNRSQTNLPTFRTQQVRRAQPPPRPLVVRPPAGQCVEPRSCSYVRGLYATLSAAGRDRRLLLGPSIPAPAALLRPLIRRQRRIQVILRRAAGAVRSVRVCPSSQAQTFTPAILTLCRRVRQDGRTPLGRYGSFSLQAPRAPDSFRGSITVIKWRSDA